MGTAILTLLVALAPAVVQIIQLILQKQAAKGVTDEDLRRRSLDELHAATDRVQPPPPVQ